MVQLSINQVTSKQWSLEEDAFFYNHFQFQGAGLWRYKVGEFGDEKTRALMDESQLKASSLGCVGGLTGGGDRWADSVRESVDALVSAHVLGAPNVVLFTGGRNRHILSQAKRCVTTAIERLLPLAQEFGIRLLLQPMLESISHRWNFIHDWKTLFEIIDRFPSSDVGFVLNTYHASFLGDIWEQLPGRMGQLGLVQISDSVGLPKAGRLRDDCLLGQGVLLPDLRLKQIISAGYRGWVEVEVLGPTWGRQGYRQVLESSQQFVNEFMVQSAPVPRNGSTSRVV